MLDSQVRLRTIDDALKPGDKLYGRKFGFAAKSLPRRNALIQKRDAMMAISMSPVRQAVSPPVATDKK